MAANGFQALPQVTEVLITADSGGSNASYTHKVQPQRLADALGFQMSVWYLRRAPTSGIRSSIGCFATSPRIGGVIVNLIPNTTTTTGLRIKACLDNSYPTGIKATDRHMADLQIKGMELHNPPHDLKTSKKMKTYHYLRTNP